LRLVGVGEVWALPERVENTRHDLIGLVAIDRGIRERITQRSHSGDVNATG